MTARWVARPPSLKLATTPEYQLGKMRQLELLAIEGEVEREEEFDRRMAYLNWDYSTAATYWSQVIKSAEDVQLPIPYSMRIKARLLRNLAQECAPGRPTKPISAEQVFAALPTLPPDLRAAVALAFTLGQRMGDTMKLQVGCLSEVLDSASNTTFLAIQYRRGKTTRRRQPFSLHVPRQGHLASELLQLQQSGLENSLLFPSAADPDKALSTIRSALQAIDSDLGILSIRRGGLQLLALSGASTEVLMHHSRHASIAMLERYLGFGLLHLHPCRMRYLGRLPDTVTPELQEKFFRALDLSMTRF
jgi:hypothetical protein